jgi:hypothetical protein
LLLVAAVPAAATPVRVDFSGVLSAALDPAGLLDGLALGTPFTGFVEYDSSRARGFSGDFFSTPTTSGRIRITFAGGNTTRSGEMQISVRNDGPRGDELVISGLRPSSVFFAGGDILRFETLYVAFRDPSGAMFSSVGLQAHVPPGVAAQVEAIGCRWTAATQFDYCNAIVEDLFFATLRVDAYRFVPEPASALLVACGVAMFSCVRSRYGDHTNCAQ